MMWILIAWCMLNTLALVFVLIVGERFCRTIREAALQNDLFGKFMADIDMRERKLNRAWLPSEPAEGKDEKGVDHA